MARRDGRRGAGGMATAPVFRRPWSAAAAQKSAPRRERAAWPRAAEGMTGPTATAFVHRAPLAP
jgi:hypothetical protein